MSIDVCQYSCKYISVSTCQFHTTICRACGMSSLVILFVSIVQPLLSPCVHGTTQFNMDYDFTVNLVGESCHGMLLYVLPLSLL